VIDYQDVVITIVLLLIVVLGFLYELAGETVPGWHTISYQAHRSWLVRGIILFSVVGLFFALAVHFQNNAIFR
jgi:nitrate reductase gamma subunit